MATHIFTSAAANYIPKARVLAQSVRRFHPDWTFHLVLCDELPSALADPKFFDSVLTLGDLDIPDLKSWLFQHSLVEASTAVKGFALRKILSFADCDHVIYFDPDIVVLSSLYSLLSEFERSSILLTPHSTEPEATEQAIVDNELTALQYGIYNLGFIGVKNDSEGHRFASWWCDRLQSFCFDDRPRGLFTDQRWADLVPAYFPNCAILRDSAYNVCTWNLTHRTVSGSVSEGLLVNGRPIGFYHFSGFDSGSQQGMLDRYGSTMPALYELREWYGEACSQMDEEQFSRLPWTYDFFDNAERILRKHRQRYREQTTLQATFPDPFVATNETDSYLTWFNLHDDYRAERGTSATPAEDDTEQQPNYRIIVLATAVDAAYLLDTCLRILESSFLRSDLLVVASVDAVQIGTLPSEFRVVAVEALRYSELFMAALERFADKDLLLVRAGAVPPPFWDLRLSWSAARQPGAFSVSPLDRRVLDSSGVLGKVNDKTLDRYCYWYRRAGDEEVATVETDCVYILASALRDVTGVRKPSNASDLVTQAVRLRYRNVLATHICLAWNVPRQTADALEVVGSNRWSIKRFRDTLRIHRPESLSWPIPAVTPGTLPTLHISHSWGGGIERWLSEFADADKVHANLVLKSEGPEGAYGKTLGLYRYTRVGVPPDLLQTWELKPGIAATDVRNQSYAAMLGDISRQYRFGKILVSSLIGHSLECLNQDVPTAFICHDYYPFCSAVNLTFGEVCSSCEVPRLRACLEENPLNRSFPNVPVPEWLAIRAGFGRLVQERRIPLIAPSPAAEEIYSRAFPAIAELFQVIPHGTRRPPCGTIDVDFQSDTPLRILILGSMALHKGRLLLESLIPELLEFADLTLAGCFDFADHFLPNPRLRVIPSYDRESLCHLVEEIRPEVGLLLSTFPETFSYTLHELQSMAIPPVATRVGSFTSWIRDGENGFLFDPEPHALLTLLRSLQENKRPLEKVHQALKSFVLRSPEAMVEDYRKLSDTKYSSQRYFNGPSAPPPLQGRSLQLYWRTRDAGFSERNSMAALPFGGERQTARLYYVTSGSAAAELRLDLATQPGFLLLHDVRLLGRRGETLWSIGEHVGPLQAERLSQCFVLEQTGKNGDMLLCLTGEDPYIVLPIPVELLNQSQGAGSLEVDFTPEPEHDYLSALTRFAESYEIRRVEFAAIARNLSERESEWLALDNQRIALDNQRLALENELKEKEQLLRAMQPRLGEIESLNNRLSASEEARLQSVEQLRKQTEALRLAQVHTHDLTRSLQSTKAELMQREHLVEGLLDSVSWKLTGPLRTIARLSRKITNGNGSGSDRS